MLSSVNLWSRSHERSDFGFIERSPATISMVISVAPAARWRRIDALIAAVRAVLSTTFAARTPWTAQLNLDLRASAHPTSAPGVMDIFLATALIEMYFGLPARS